VLTPPRHRNSKHVVLASVHAAADEVPSAAARIDYLTLSPDIQQSTNRDHAPRPEPRAHAAATS
jgi:hypothetical protein